MLLSKSSICPMGLKRTDTRRCEVGAFQERPCRHCFGSHAPLSKAEIYTFLWSVLAGRPFFRALYDESAFRWCIGNAGLFSNATEVARNSLSDVAEWWWTGWALSESGDLPCIYHYGFNASAAVVWDLSPDRQNPAKSHAPPLPPLPSMVIMALRVLVPG